MSEQDRNTTRRSFIVKSAFAVGTVASGFYVSRRGYAAGKKNSNHVRVQQRYPWYADVAGRGQATMYLLKGMPLGTHLLGYVANNGTEQPGWPLANNGNANAPATAVINYMRDRALLLSSLSTSGSNNGSANKDEREQAAADMQQAINETNSGPTIELPALTAALNNVINEVNALPAGDVKKTWTYLDYAKNPTQDWPPLVLGALSLLDALISVPILKTVHTDFDDNNGCYQHVPHDYRTRELEDLFVKQRVGGGIDPLEIDYWLKIRNLGLLWCTPRGCPGIVLNANSRRCDTTTHKCVPGSANDYCQEVDGVCNPMSG